MQTDEALHVLDAALARARRDRLRRKTPLVDFTAPVLWGERGAPSTPDDQGRACWSYNVTQVRRMRARFIRQLVAEARRATGPDHTGGTT